MWDLPKIINKTVNIVRTRGTGTMGSIMEVAAAGGNVMESMVDTVIGAVNINTSAGVRLISTLGTVVDILEPQQFNSVVVLNAISTFSSYMLTTMVDRGTVNGMVYGVINNVLVPINVPNNSDPRRRAPRAQAPSPQQQPHVIPVPVPIQGIPGIPQVVNVAVQAVQAVPAFPAFPAPSTPLQVVANALRGPFSPRYTTINPTYSFSPVSPVSPSPISPAYNPVERELDATDYDNELMEVTLVA